MASLDDLEFVITANTTLLRGQLEQGAQQVERFTNRAESSLNRHQQSLEHISRSVRKLVELYGLMAAVRWAERQISDATQLNKLTQEQADKLAGARSEVEKLGEAWETMWRRAAIGGSGFFETVARGLRGTIEDVSGGPSTQAGQISDVQRQIAEHNAALQSGHVSFLGMDITLSAQGIAKYRAELDTLWETYKRLQAVDPAKTLGQIDWEKKLSALQEITVGRTGRILPPGPLAGVSTEMLKQAVELAEQLKTPLEKDLQTLGDIRTLVANGLLPESAINKFADEKLVGFDLEAIHQKMEKLPKVTDEAAEAAKRFSEAFAASFESRGIQALLDGDLSGSLKGLVRDFAEMGLRILILQPLAEKLANTLKSGGGFGGGSTGIFSGIFSLFGGGKAEGGPLEAGKWYIAGERGPEPIWGGGSGAFAAGYGGGSGVHVTQHNHFDVSLESVDNRIAQAAGPISNLAAQAVRTSLMRPRMA